MADEVTTPAAEPEKKKRGRQPRKPDYESDPNVQARGRAGERSNKRGKKAEEPAPEEAKTEDATPPVEEPAEPPVEDVTPPADETVPPVAETAPETTEGGIVADAQEEVQAATEAVEEKAEGGAGTPAEEKMEGEMPPPAPERAAPEAPMAEAPKAPMHEPVGEYAPPEGPSHDEVFEKLMDAMAFGDVEGAKEAWRSLMNHVYMEHAHRAKSEEQALREAQEYLSATEEIAAKHPELGEDGIEADKVLALSDVYRLNGMTAVEALRAAVADLYQDTGAPAAETSVPPVEAAAGLDTETEAESKPEEPIDTVPEITEEKPEEKEEPVIEAAAGKDEEPEPLIPDMTERKERKRTIGSVPSASARNEPPPPPKEPTRMDAIADMKKARGQR